MKDFLPYFLLTIGGGLGTAGRILVTVLLDRFTFQMKFPIHTFAVNVTGSFVIGILIAFMGTQFKEIDVPARYALAVGFIGGYTTFSTFAFEKHHLIESGSWGIAALYAGVTVVLGILLVRLGIAVGQWFT